MAISSPIDLLLPYQRPVFDDPARFVCWLAGRQIGKSFTGAGRFVRAAYTTPKTDFMIASPSERQSLEAALKCRQWSEAFDFAIADVLEERDAPGALMKSSTIVYPNGSRIIAVPGKPDTVRGFTAHLWMDEFAFFDDPDATWRGIVPSINNALKGRKRIFITSTPNGRTGRGERFFRICDAPLRGGWSLHKTTFPEAAPFIGADVEELRRMIDDEETWRQEYLCEFVDGSNVLLPYDLIATCESVEASTGPRVGAAAGPLFLGIDFGRTSDPTVCWTLERIGDVLWTREVLCLRSMSTPDQLDVLRPRIAAAARVALDYTGPGIGFGDLVEKEFGRYDPECHQFGIAELFTFSPASKLLLFPRLRSAFERRALRVPMDVDCREDLHEMQQTVRDGRYSYSARRTAEGHSDRCTALALAVRAASTATAWTFEPEAVEPGEGDRAEAPASRTLGMRDEATTRRLP